MIRGELKDAMRAVPRAHQSKIALSLETFDALMGHIVKAIAPTEADRLAAMVAPASEMEAVGQLLFDLTLGQSEGAAA